MEAMFEVVQFFEDYEEIVENFHNPRRIIRDAENPIEYYRDREFYTRYRFNKETVMAILMMFENELMKENRRGLPIPPIIQLLISLRYYATGK